MGLIVFEVLFSLSPVVDDPIQTAVPLPIAPENTLLQTWRKPTCEDLLTQFSDCSCNPVLSAILMPLYAAGRRRAERRPEVSDVDHEQMLVHVRGGQMRPEQPGHLEKKMRPTLKKRTLLPSSPAIDEIDCRMCPASTSLASCRKTTPHLMRIAGSGAIVRRASEIGTFPYPTNLWKQSIGISARSPANAEVPWGVYRSRREDE
jgi:hypothetical protein